MSYVWRFSLRIQLCVLVLRTPLLLRARLTTVVTNKVVLGYEVFAPRPLKPGLAGQTRTETNWSVQNRLNSNNNKTTRGKLEIQYT